MKTIDRVFWGSAVVAVIIASTMENPHTMVANPLQGTMFIIAACLALVPIFVRVIKTNATWGTIGFLVTVAALVAIFH
jgi:hypothetical protein